MHGDLQLMRAIKDAEEIELMRHAQSITDAAFAHMCEFIRPGLTEKQLRTCLLYTSSTPAWIASTHSSCVRRTMS